MINADGSGGSGSWYKLPGPDYAECCCLYSVVSLFVNFTH